MTEALATSDRLSLEPALDDASAIAAMLGDRRLKVAFVTCSYDTGFEAVEEQVIARIAQIEAAFGRDGPVHWSLWIVDDLPARAGFSARVEQGFERAPRALRDAMRLRCIPMTSKKPRRTGLKGQALLDGMRAALAEEAEVIVYINLNLKVRAELAATGLRAMLAGGWDACIGSRASIDGGRALGAGRKGRIKSRAYNRFVRAALPALARYKDTNAPLKIFTADAARCLVRHSKIPTVTMDAEWLWLLHSRGFAVTLFPITWTQRPGSRPPWAMIPQCAWDVVQIRRRALTLP